MSTTDVNIKTCHDTMSCNCSGTELEVISPDPQVSGHSVDFERIEWLTTELLHAIGEDPSRPGLLDTPRRVANHWREFIEYDAGKTETTFASVEADQMIVVTGMRVWSLCEHHMLPFWADISIGYVPNERVLGLSKFARIAKKHAHSLQIQERLVQQIADEIVEVTGSENVAVTANGVHLCMTMRGVKTEGQFRSSVMRGLYRHAPQVRKEFFDLVSMDNK